VRTAPGGWGCPVIAEALEAVWLVASALAAWIVAGVVAVTVGLYAVVVAGWGIWRVVVAAYAAVAARTGLCARLSHEVPEDAPRLPRPRERPATPRSAIPSGERKRSEAA
jgi:hypothetical protein